MNATQRQISPKRAIDNLTEAMRLLFEARKKTAASAGCTTKWLSENTDIYVREVLRGGRYEIYAKWPVQNEPESILPLPEGWAPHDGGLVEPGAGRKPVDYRRWEAIRAEGPGYRFSATLTFVWWETQDGFNPFTWVKEPEPWVYKAPKPEPKAKKLPDPSILTEKEALVAFENGRPCITHNHGRTFWLHWEVSAESAAIPDPRPPLPMPHLIQPYPVVEVVAGLLRGNRNMHPNHYTPNQRTERREDASGNWLYDKQYKPIDFPLPWEKRRGLLHVLPLWNRQGEVRGKGLFLLTPVVIGRQTYYEWTTFHKQYLRLARYPDRPLVCYIPPLREYETKQYQIDEHAKRVADWKLRIGGRECEPPYTKTVKWRYNVRVYGVLDGNPGSSPMVGSSDFDYPSEAAALRAGRLCNINGLTIQKVEDKLQGPLDPPKALPPIPRELSKGITSKWLKP
jgi:hypothetical protein